MTLSFVFFSTSRRRSAASSVGRLCTFVRCTLSSVVSDVMDVELFFLARLWPGVVHLGASVWHFHRPLLVWETSCLQTTRKTWTILFSTVLGHCHTSPGDVYRYKGNTTLHFYSVNCLVRWTVIRIRKVGRDMVKSWIITDNQDFSCLIIKVFDNQTVSSPWEHLIDPGVSRHVVLCVWKTERRTFTHIKSHTRIV